MKIEGKIQLNKVHCSNADDYISLSIQDEKAMVTFLEVSLTPAQLGDILTSRGEVKCEINVIGLDRVGKVREHKELVFPVENRTGQREYAEKNCQKFAAKGWTASNYFSSQNSFFELHGQHYARGSQTRWVKRKR